MSDLTVSCVVPVFNGARYLADALKSVLEQTRPPNEIVVIDDGSTDDSAAVARSFDEVTLIMKSHGGPASARNHGVSAATGELIAFIDQDDLWHAEKLERQVACFIEDPLLDLCFAHAEMFWDDDLRTERDAYAGHARAGPVPGYSTPALLARRSAFERVGPLDTDLLFGDATDWALRAIDTGLKIQLLPETLLYHRMHGSNLTRQRQSSKAEFVRIVRTTLHRRRTMRGRSADDL